MTNEVLNMHRQLHDEPLTANRQMQAAVVSRKLEDRGVRVYNVWHNGRQPVLYLDRPPEGVTGVSQRRQPAAGGVDRIMAAPFDGVQIEWAVFEPFAVEVACAQQ